MLPVGWKPLEETMTRWSTPALLVLCTSCTPDTEIHALTPSLVVAPDAVDFGEVVVDYNAEERVEIINSGKATAKIDEVSWLDGTVTQLNMAIDSMEIERDDRTVLMVTCLPTTYDTYADTIRLSSNDPDRPELDIPVTCTGTHAPTPDIALSSTNLDFGTVEVGTPVLDYVTLTNRGDGDLYIASVMQAGSGSFAVLTDLSGQTIAPDNSREINVLYTPTVATGDSGVLSIVSNDPDETTTDLLFFGNCEEGDCDYEYPVAIIEGATESEPLETFTLDGSSSYDPRDQELIYSWYLSKWPAGSGGHIGSAVDDFTELYVDLAGEYQVTLEVINEDGVKSAPAKHDVNVLPSDKVHVEMYWDSANSDLDLHLAQEGTPIFLEPSDCNYCNVNPDWGEPGEGADDPSLDLDDVTGFGPENINIADPADGGYDMWVHYFRDQGAGAVVATVKVYLTGGEVFEASQVMEYDDRWFVGPVLWPDNVVAENEGEPITSGGQRGCYEEED
jgi:hypothetical protein